MSKKLTIDLLQMEIDSNSPNWLSPAAQFPPNRLAITARHRAKHLAKQKAAGTSRKAKAAV